MSRTLLCRSSIPPVCWPARPCAGRCRASRPSPDAPLPVIIALAQTPVSADVPRNLRHIKAMMRKAKAAGAELVQFTEGALSGYGRKVLTPFEQWRAEDWAALRAASDEVARPTGELKLWVLVGSVHPLEDERRPHNCLYLIGPD